MGFAYQDQLFYFRTTRTAKLSKLVSAGLPGSHCAFTDCDTHASAIHTSPSVALMIKPTDDGVYASANAFLTPSPGTADVQYTQY